MPGRALVVIVSVVRFIVVFQVVRLTVVVEVNRLTVEPQPEPWRICEEQQEIVIPILDPIAIQIILCVPRN